MFTDKSRIILMLSSLIHWTLEKSSYKKFKWGVYGDLGSFNKCIYHTYLIFISVTEKNWLSLGFFFVFEWLCVDCELLNGLNKLQKDII